jgi:catechol 2,3-dioxygenase-like lactoylglutathione lyase family enzyme
VDWKLELIAVPVSDVDRAKAFYTEKLGFNDPDGNAWAVQQIPPRD